MSTNLKTLKGTCEHLPLAQGGTTELHMAKFCSKEGIKLLLSIPTQNDFFTHVALSKSEVITLIEELKENFDL
jgi:hypothetical protein